MRIFLLLCCIVIQFISLSASAQLVTSWRGPERNGIYPETGLLREWPDEGPEILWSFEGLGQGYSSPSFANDRIYLTGMIGRTGYVFILSEVGGFIKSYEYGSEFYQSYPGSRSTPVIANDLLYLVTGMGEILCLEADTGEKIWSKNAVIDFGSSNIRWGITENLLIDGDRIFFAAGGKEHNIVALDRFTGEIIWSSPGTGKGELSAYCSPLIVELADRKVFVTHMEHHLVGLDAESGKFLWSHPITNTNRIHANTPIFQDGYIFAFSVRESGCVKLKLNTDGSSIDVTWENMELSPSLGGAVIIDDYIFSCSYMDRRWLCVDWKSGETMFSVRDIDRGTVIYADGRLYCYTERGEIFLVRPNPEKLEITGKTEINIGSGEHFSHPVIRKGKMYVRRGDAIVVFDIEG